MGLGPLITMKIYCKDLEDLVNTAEILLHKGIQFDASTDVMIIRLTGGF